MEIDLQLDLVTKRYGTLAAVERVCLAVGRGEFLTLLGPSGCGKTTLLRMIAGFVTPTSGDIVLRGEIINKVLPHQRNIGIVFQNYALFPHMTVSANVAFGLRMHGISRARSRHRVDELLQLVKLQGLHDRYPHQLSGGQQQRVALARVLAVEPILLLLDEPFGALDKKLRGEMQIELRHLITSLRLTTIFVTHDQEEAMRMSDRIAVMHQGRIIQCDAPSVVYDHPSDLFVAGFIGTSNLLRGKVRTSSDTTTRSVEVEGAGLHVPMAASVRDEDQTDVLVMIRPENLAIAAGDASSVSGWRGHIGLAIHAGTTMEYEVTLRSGQRLGVSEPRTSAKQEWRVGDEITVRVVDSRSCRVFPIRRGADQPRPQGEDILDQAPQFSAEVPHGDRRPAT